MKPNKIKLPDIGAVLLIQMDYNVKHVKILGPMESLDLREHTRVFLRELGYEFNNNRLAFGGGSIGGPNNATLYTTDHNYGAEFDSEEHLIKALEEAAAVWDASDFYLELDEY